MKGLDYDGFNMVLGDSQSVFHISNRSDESNSSLNIGDNSGATLYITELKRGHCYAVSNASLDTPWEKVTKGKAIFSSIVREMGCRGDSVYGKAPPKVVDRDEGAENLINDCLANEVS